MTMKATEKQQRYILFLASQHGYKGSDFIDATLGKMMGLSMRERSGAGRLREYVADLDPSTASDVIGRLK
jgi:hypothetical protein